MERKMNKKERAKMVMAMERIVRNINNEDIFESWLYAGVADGDIEDNTDWDEVDEYYLKDDNFKDLMSLFLRLMNRAYKDGGLYSDGIVSKDMNDYK